MEGRSAAGYWVDANSLRRLADNICFMGCRNDLLTTDGIWVDDVDFAALFQRFRVNVADPEVILIAGWFVKDNGFQGQNVTILFNT